MAGNPLVRHHMDGARGRELERELGRTNRPVMEMVQPSQGAGQSAELLPVSQ
jgi:hypothetical protein